MKLDNKVAIVTGGASGIGRAIVQTLIKDGAKVVIVDINDALGQALADELGDAALYTGGDISNAESAAQICRTAVEQFGGLNILINNAHASSQAPFLEQTEEMFELSFKSGFYGTYQMMRAAYPHLEKTRGSVVNFGSGAALEGRPTQTSYAAAKEAIRGISRVAANEWSKAGVRVNVVCPIAVTGGVADWAAAFPDDYAKTIERIPLGRMGDPEEDIAPVVAFLASDDSKFMTGQTLMVDGGTIKLR
ncbi:glucose 1-dehydrogenase [Prescottella defluvii]|uniref:SDR family NAD(P)-dependent oxidoreductase n=1 Tax=Prescottella defluvii TaxID=1323361 RepID=UPI0004F2AC98|nr:glucose 1-dehydrogenase [Prescottella defluvii]